MKIKFRGKTVDTNEWVYGDLLQNEEGCFIVLDSESSNNYGDGTDLYATNWYKVREGTIGQYINRDYAHSSDLYMGDIVEINDLRGNFKGVGVIQYNNCSFYINTGYMSCYRWTDYEVEKIGNGIDNPELLKEILD